MEMGRRFFLEMVAEGAAGLTLDRLPARAMAGRRSPAERGPTNLMMSRRAAAAPARERSEPWRGGFKSVDQEMDYEIEKVEGRIPAGLTGTLYRNGPARNDVNGHPLGHWFDGDGMLAAVTFEGGRAWYRNRFVRTRKYLSEKAAGRILYRGYGTQRPGGPLANAFRMPENAANTSVVYHGDKLLALWEGGRPYALDPADLSTIGEDDYAGQLTARMPFSAHPQVDPATGELWNFGVSYGPRTTLHVYCVDAGGRLVKRRDVPLGDAVYTHAFALTENYAVFCLGPVFLSRGLTPPLAFLAGFKSFEEALAWDPSTPTKILLVPRGEGEVRVIEAEPFYQFHFGNAHEHDGQVWVDVLRYPDFRINAALRLPLDLDSTPGAEVWRYRIDPRARKAEGQRLAPDWVELAQYDQRRNAQGYRYLYGLSQIKNGDFDTRLVKFDLEAGRREQHDFGPLNYPGEPIFVPARASAEEDEGWIVSFVYAADEHLTKVAILDARDFTARPVATLTLRAHVPYGFHGNFTPRTFGTGRSA